MDPRPMWMVLLAGVLPAAAQKPPALPETVIRINVNLVQVDAVVADARGNSVPDLKAADFEILQDGKPKLITNFSYHQVAAARTRSNYAPPAPRAALKPAEVRRTIVVVVDDLTMPFEDVTRVREAMKKFVDQQVQPGDLVAILRTSGGMGALQQFSSDARVLRAAVDQIRYNPMGRGNLAFVPLSNDPAAEAMQERAEVWSVGTLGSLRYVTDGLREMPGRKSLILFSESLPLFRAPNYVDSDNPLGPPPDTGGTVPGMGDALQRLIEAANRASMVIYTVDPRGLQVDGYDRDRTANSQDGLVVLAHDTGGLFLANNNDLNLQLGKALADSEGYYLIGYHPDAGTFEPHADYTRYHRIEVRLKRPGLRVRTRSGFYGTPDAGDGARRRAAPLTAQEQLLRALDSPFAAGGIRIRLTPIFTASPEAGPFLNTMLYIDATDLAFTDEPDGSHKAVFDLLAVTYGGDGAIVGRTNRTYAITARGESYESGRRQGFLYAFAHPVKKPAAYQFRVALRDARSQQIGSASQYIEVPDLKKGRLTLSSVILREASAALPSTGETGGIAVGGGLQGSAAVRIFRSGTQVEYGYQILNARAESGHAPDLETQVAVWHDGRQVFAGTPRKFDATGQANPRQLAAVGRLELGKLAAGDYVLQVKVSDRLANEKYRTASQWSDFQIQ